MMVKIMNNDYNTIGLYEHNAESYTKVKEALIPYIAGCVVIFTAFAVWKIVIELLGGLA